MSSARWKSLGPLLVAALGGLLPVVTAGCQSTVAGQTLPSAYYLRDDVQFFPAGPEFKLSNQVRAIEEFQLQQELGDGGGGGGGGEGGGGGRGEGGRASSDRSGSSRPSAPRPAPSLSAAAPPPAIGSAPPSVPSSGAPSQGTGIAGTSGGATTPMLGRVDSNNRLNIFDNNSAIPKSRMWVGYLVAGEQDPHIRLEPGVVAGDLASINPGSTGDIVTRNDVQVLRMGAELAITESFSIAGQGQQVYPFNANDAEAGWTNPQVIAKLVIARSEHTVWSAVTGLNIEIDEEPFVINDTSSRIFAGALYFAEIAPEVYSQGGANFSFATGDDAHTFDWTTGLGYWAYRHHTLKHGKRRGQPQPFFIGFSPAIYVLGKHTVAGNSTDDLPHGGIALVDQEFMFRLARYEEPEHVVDMTVGATVHMRHGLVLNFGTSFAVTGPQARGHEFLSALNWYY